MEQVMEAYSFKMIQQ